MLRAMGAALDYYRAHFGPYQFHYARIIEFPGYASFAQAFAGTMPYSESIGFNANTDDPDQDRLHDLCRRPRDVAPILGAPGDRRRHAGRDDDQRDARAIFGADGDEAPLRPGQDPPLPEVRARQLSAQPRREAVEELPLERVENQQYIHYRKGSLVMYLLQERLGEDAVDRALARFVAKWRFKGPPYPRSIDLIDEFRKEAKTPEQQQLITDLFEKITLYDLKVTDAVDAARTRPAGRRR